MTLADSVIAGVRRATFKRRRSVSLVVHLYGSPNPKRDDGGWPCSSGGAVVVSVGVQCPECGRTLRVEVPDECEGDAVCEHCGDRVGRVLRVVPPEPERAPVPVVKPSGLRWVYWRHPSDACVDEWHLYADYRLLGKVRRTERSWQWMQETGVWQRWGSLSECSRLLVDAVQAPRPALFGGGAHG